MTHEESTLVEANLCGVLLALETASFIFGSCRCRVFAWVRCINEENNQLPTVHTGHCTVCSRIYHLVLLLNPIDRDLLFQSVETQYTNYASIYSQGLTKTAEAYRIINDMLERGSSARFERSHFILTKINNETILDVADTLAVDDIYLYNLDGEIEFSTREVYLGWKATPGHPSMLF